MKLIPLDDQEQALLRQTIGLRCRKARESLGLSQRGLAKVMARSPSWVREVEQGQQFAPAYLIQALGRATGRSPSWFYGHDGAVDHNHKALAEEIVAALKGGLLETTSLPTS